MPNKKKTGVALKCEDHKFTSYDIPYFTKSNVMHKHLWLIASAAVNLGVSHHGVSLSQLAR